MRFILKDYQEDAVADVLGHLIKATKFYRDGGDRSSFSLAATTGAGKTVVAAAVIEAMFYGDETFDFEADPSAVVLWFSDDPSLNEQTRFRLMEASDRIASSRLEVVPSTFSAESFEPGKVYFLNTSKLSKNSLLVRGHDDYLDANSPVDLRPDGRPYTIWDTIKNTIEDDRLTLYMILDEAHRGMRETKVVAQEKPTIVRRLINGHADVPPMPIVWGISATVARFDEAMKGAQNRITLPSIQVDSARVQASGLLKDDILLDIPSEAGAFDTVLLKRATRKIVELTSEWDCYVDTQGGDRVVPLMVLQAPNTPDPLAMSRALDVISNEWPGLSADSFAHVFGERTTQEFGKYLVPYISPERVQDATHVRVLIAKDAVSTGWDCPRAEILVSFRPARDHTHITQLLGRMVRTPLARRIPGNDRLNAVDCLLPFFDRPTAVSVAKALMNADDVRGLDEQGTGSGGGDGRRVLIDACDMHPNPGVGEEVWDCLGSLPSQAVPKRAAKPVRRLAALAQALSDDGLVPGAGKAAYAELHALLDGVHARYEKRINQNIEEVLTVEGETIHGTMADGRLDYGRFAENADDRVISAEVREAGRALGQDIVRTYVDYLVGPHAEESDLRDAHVSVAAMSKVPETKQTLEREANRIAAEWLSLQRVAIKGLGDDRQAVYNDLASQSPDPQRVFLSRPRVRNEETKDAEGTPLPTRRWHLLCDQTGDYPVANLNDWELQVLDSELRQPGLLAWYRNPSRASQDSIAVAYFSNSGVWKVMRPDFLFFTRLDDLVRTSIVDPHGIHLADCLPKLRGLADFAESFGDELHRIESIAMLDGTLRVLDLQNPAVRSAVRDATQAEVLYGGEDAADY